MSVGSGHRPAATVKLDEEVLYALVMLMCQWPMISECNWETFGNWRENWRLSGYSEVSEISPICLHCSSLVVVHDVIMPSVYAMKCFGDLKTIITVKLNGPNQIGETCVFIIEVTSLGDEFILMELSGIDSLFLSKSDSWLLCVTERDILL